MVKQVTPVCERVLHTPVCWYKTCSYLSVLSVRFSPLFNLPIDLLFPVVREQVKWCVQDYPGQQQLEGQDKLTGQYYPAGQDKLTGQYNLAGQDKLASLVGQCYLVEQCYLTGQDKLVGKII